MGVIDLKKSLVLATTVLATAGALSTTMQQVGVQAAAEKITEITHPVPTRVVATFFGNEKTQKGIAWHTDIDSGSDVQAIRTMQAPNKEADWAYSLKFKGISNPVTPSGSTTSKPDPLKGFTHKVTLTTLMPGANYWYRVGDAKTNTWSPVQKFNTESSNNQSAQFLFADDTQSIDHVDNDQKKARITVEPDGDVKSYYVPANLLAKGMDQEAKTDFVLQGGDLVEISDINQQWASLFKHTSGTIGKTTFMPVTGNHDANPEAFRNQFNLNEPASSKAVTNGMYSSFNYGPAHFVMLNTNDLTPEHTMGQAQVDWMIQDVAQAKKNGSKWIIAAFHKGTQTVAIHAGDKDVRHMRAQLQPIFDKIGVNVILQGHDHSYSRSVQMKGMLPDKDAVFEEGTDNTVVYNPKGQTYFTINASCQKKYEIRTKDELNALGVYPAKMAQPHLEMFARVNVTNDKFVYKAYTYDAQKGTGDAKLFDQYEILKADKPAAADKKALEATIQKDTKLVQKDYTVFSWTPFSVALASAQKVMTNPAAKQAEIDAANKGLIAAQMALVKAETEAKTPVNKDNKTNDSAKANSSSVQQPGKKSATASKSDNYSEKGTHSLPQTGEGKMQKILLALSGLMVLVLGCTLYFVKRNQRNKAQK